MNKKPYLINQSPLFKVVGLGQLEHILQIKLVNLGALISDDNYRVWTTSKGREIQQPIKWLAQVHERIARFISRIELPDYVYSQKGRSYIDNAKQHLGLTPLGKTDISNFYPSTTHKMVVDMFIHQFQCARDVARILADICCFRKQHLPTGSKLSGRVAFFSALSMFDEIERTAKERGCKMTLYVDDITISGIGANKKLLCDVRQIVRRHGLKTKCEKTKTFPLNAPKTVTGAIVLGSEIKLPNSRHLKLHAARRALVKSDNFERQRLLLSYRGRLREAGQVLSYKSTM